MSLPGAEGSSDCMEWTPTTTNDTRPLEPFSPYIPSSPPVAAQTPIPASPSQLRLLRQSGYYMHGSQSYVEARAGLLQEQIAYVRTVQARSQARPGSRYHPYINSSLVAPLLNRRAMTPTKSFRLRPDTPYQPRLLQHQIDNAMDMEDPFPLPKLLGPSISATPRLGRESWNLRLLSTGRQAAPLGDPQLLTRGKRVLRGRPVFNSPNQRADGETPPLFRRAQEGAAPLAAGPYGQRLLLESKGASPQQTLKRKREEASIDKVIAEEDLVPSRTEQPRLVKRVCRYIFGRLFSRVRISMLPDTTSPGPSPATRRRLRIVPGAWPVTPPSERHFEVDTRPPIIFPALTQSATGESTATELAAVSCAAVEPEIRQLEKLKTDTHEPKPEEAVLKNSGHEEPEMKSSVPGGWLSFDEIEATELKTEEVLAQAVPVPQGSAPSEEAKEKIPATVSGTQQERQQTESSSTSLAQPESFAKEDMQVKLFTEEDVEPKPFTIESAPDYTPPDIPSIRPRFRVGTHRQWPQPARDTAASISNTSAVRPEFEHVKPEGLDAAVDTTSAVPNIAISGPEIDDARVEASYPAASAAVNEELSFLDDAPQPRPERRVRFVESAWLDKPFPTKTRLYNRYEAIDYPVFPMGEPTFLTSREGPAPASPSEAGTPLSNPHFPRFELSPTVPASVDTPPAVREITNRLSLFEVSSVHVQRRHHAEKKAAEQRRREAEEKRRVEEERLRLERVAEEEKLRKEKIVRALSAGWSRTVDDAMNGKVSHSSMGSSGITRKDFGTILPQRNFDDPKGWLNDEVVNTFLSMMVRRALEKTGYNKTSDETPKYHAFNTNLYTNIRDRGYKSVERWAFKAKIHLSRMLKCERILIPIHSASHWTLMCISGTERTISYYDSMSNDKADFSRLTDIGLQFVAGNLRSFYKPEEWKIIDTRSVQQANALDCGVFVCMNALALISGKNPLKVFSAADMPAARRQIAATLYNGAFTGDFDF